MSDDSSVKGPLFARIIEGVAAPLNILVVLGLVGSIIYLWDQPLAIERAFVFGSIAFFMGLAITDYFYLVSKLTSSMVDLRKMEAGEFGTISGSTWSGKIYSDAKEWKVDRGHQYVDLPDPALFVEPQRLAAERAGVILHWFSGAAVLFGLVGTIIGLGMAIGGALDALSIPDAEDFAKNLGAALSPLQFAFYSSAAGIVASVFLVLLKKVSENRLDQHFSVVERELSEAYVAEIFTDWQPSDERLLIVANELSRVADMMKNQLEEISKNILETLAKQIKEDFKGIPERVVSSIKEGIESAARDSLSQQKKTLHDLGDQHNAIRRTFEEVGKNYDQYQKSLTDRIGALNAGTIEVKNELKSLQSTLHKIPAEMNEQSKMHSQNMLLQMKQFGEGMTGHLNSHKKGLLDVNEPVKQMAEALSVSVNNLERVIANLDMKGIEERLGGIEGATTGIVEVSGRLEEVSRSLNVLEQTVERVIAIDSAIKDLIGNVEGREA